MCRMIGVVFNSSFPRGSLEDLRHVAEVGKVPDQGEEEDGHRDGWGMVSFRRGSPFYMGRSARPIHIDPSFDQAAKGIGGLERPNILICHARRGTEGATNLQNTHPFVTDGIVFAHNGSVKEYHPKTAYAPRGDSDSARVFSKFVDEYSETRDVREALARLLKDSVHGHSFTGLIFLISDGKALHGYREYGPGRDADYYNLKAARCGDTVVLFQQSESEYPAGAVEHVENGELVTVGLDLTFKRERLL
jgi:predicted glutamine amidotransferase